MNNKTIFHCLLEPGSRLLLKDIPSGFLAMASETKRHKNDKKAMNMKLQNKYKIKLIARIGDDPKRGGVSELEK